MCNVHTRKALTFNTPIQEAKTLRGSWAQGSVCWSLLSPLLPLTAPQPTPQPTQPPYSLPNLQAHTRTQPLRQVVRPQGHTEVQSMQIPSWCTSGLACIFTRDQHTESTKTHLGGSHPRRGYTQESPHQEATNGDSLSVESQVHLLCMSTPQDLWFCCVQP
jgi:hypothetical protein